jgi:dethiobiotin synthetase
LKPIITGFDDSPQSDTGRLLTALDLPCTQDRIDACSPWRFAAPLSPNMAAAREGRQIALNELLEFCRRPTDARLRLFEGIGGVMVPLNEHETTLDWMALLGAPALLVCGSYLGAISHALTAHQALRSRSITVQSIIVSQSPEEPVPLEETRATIQQFVEPTPVVSLARNGDVVDDTRLHESLLEAILLVPHGN